MLDLSISVLSPTAGNDSDGVVKGGINRSTLTAVWNNISTAQNVYALRKDTTSSNSIYTDLSTQAVSGTTDAFAPFGANADMSQGDENMRHAKETIKIAKEGAKAAKTGKTGKTGMPSRSRMKNM